MKKNTLKPEKANLSSEERSFWENESAKQQSGSFETFSTISYKRIIEHFQIPSGSLGLEYACGSGAFSNFISNSKVVGLDISYNLLKSSSSVNPVQGSGEELPFKEQSFDFVLCAAALHHIPKLDLAFTEIARIIKPEGHLYILELNTNHPQRKLVSRRESRFRKTFSTTSFSPSEVLIPEKKLIFELRGRGFTLKSMVYVSPAYKNPTMVGKMQAIASCWLARGFLKKYIESYVLIHAQNTAHLSEDRG